MKALLLVALLGLLCRASTCAKCIGGTTFLGLNRVSQSTGSSCPYYGPKGCLHLLHTPSCDYSKCLTGNVFTACKDNTFFLKEDFLKCDQRGYGKCSQKHPLTVRVTKDCKVRVSFPAGKSKDGCSCTDWGWAGAAGTYFGQPGVKIAVQAANATTAPQLPAWVLTFDGKGNAQITWPSSQACIFSFKVASGPKNPIAKPKSV